MTDRSRSIPCLLIRHAGGGAVDGAPLYTVRPTLTLAEAALLADELRGTDVAYAVASIELHETANDEPRSTWFKGGH